MNTRTWDYRFPNLLRLKGVNFKILSNVTLLKSLNFFEILSSRIKSRFQSSTHLINNENRLTLRASNQSNLDLLQLFWLSKIFRQIQVQGQNYSKQSVSSFLCSLWCIPFRKRLKSFQVPSRHKIFKNWKECLLLQVFVTEMNQNYWEARLAFFLSALVSFSVLGNSKAELRSRALNSQPDQLDVSVDHTSARVNIKLSQTKASSKVGKSSWPVSIHGRSLLGFY